MPTARTRAKQSADGSPLVYMIFDMYLDRCKKHRSAGTYGWYADHIQNFLDPASMRLSGACLPRSRTPESCLWAVDSGCKTLVSQRLKLAGMRWREDGTGEMCHLRALLKSDASQWEAFWRRQYNQPASRNWPIVACCEQALYQQTRRLHERKRAGARTSVNCWRRKAKLAILMERARPAYRDNERLRDGYHSIPAVPCVCIGDRAHD